jgi:hypothetical protein
VKKVALFFIKILLLIVSVSLISGALELHEIIETPIRHVSSLPESGGLIVIGSVLIFGASLLRRRKAERSR